MTVTQSYREYVLDQLNQSMPVTGKSMFGGVSIYANGIIIGVLDDDRFFLKVNDNNRPDYESRGMQPWSPGSGPTMMSYFEVPEDVLDDIESLRGWAQKSLVVAQSAKASKRKKSKPTRIRPSQPTQH